MSRCCCTPLCPLAPGVVCVGGGVGVVGSAHHGSWSREHACREDLVMISSRRSMSCDAQGRAVGLC